MRKTIILKNDTFQKLPVIRLEFPHDFELKETVKGKKDRIVRFPEMLNDLYSECLKAYDPKKYLNEGRGEVNTAKEAWQKH